MGLSQEEKFSRNHETLHHAINLWERVRTRLIDAGTCSETDAPEHVAQLVEDLVFGSVVVDCTQQGIKQNTNTNAETDTEANTVALLRGQLLAFFSMQGTVKINTRTMHDVFKHDVAATGYILEKVDTALEPSSVFGLYENTTAQVPVQ